MYANDFFKVKYISTTDSVSLRSALKVLSEQFNSILIIVPIEHLFSAKCCTFWNVGPIIPSILQPCEKLCEMQQCQIIINNDYIILKFIIPKHLYGFERKPLVQQISDCIILNAEITLYIMKALIVLLNWTWKIDLLCVTFSEHSGNTCRNPKVTFHQWR